MYRVGSARARESAERRSVAADGSGRGTRSASRWPNCCDGPCEFWRINDCDESAGSDYAPVGWLLGAWTFVCSPRENSTHAEKIGTRQGLRARQQMPEVQPPPGCAHHSSARPERPGAPRLPGPDHDRVDPSRVPLVTTPSECRSARAV